jgi:hypothetical protein
MTSVDAARTAGEFSSTPSAPLGAESGRDRDNAWKRLFQPRTGVLLLVIGAITLVSIFSYAPIRAQGGLIRDRELVFYLSGRTADGALPLVDFQHGWNAGGWWIGSVLYRIADGSPNVFAFLFEHVTGRILAFSALAIAVWRLNRSTALIAVVGIGSAAWAAATPPHGKYAIPALWLLALLPTPSMRRSRRLYLLIHVVLAFVTLWLHVELAVLLAAGVGLFELFGVERDPLRARLERVGALGAGLVLGVASEFAFYAARGVSVSTVNDFVFGGQTSGFHQQYGWSLSGPTSSPAALFALLVLAPFVPALWRRAAPETRLAACLSLATAIIAIRRHDPQHVAAVSTLFVFTGALLADDVHRSRLPVEQPRQRGNPGLVLAAGCAWAGVLVFVGFEVESLLAGAALMAGAAVATLASRRGDWKWASGGALAVLVLIAAAGSGFVIRDRIRSTDPYTQIRTNAEAIAPEVDRCLGQDPRAVITTTQLSLYDFLGLENPTPYVQFHYDFARYAPDLVDEMRAGEVPALIQTYPLPEWMVEVRDELVRGYVRCSRVSVPATGNTITIWVDADLAPAGQRSLRAQPDGSLVSLDAVTPPASG